MNQGLFLSLQERGLVQDYVPGLDALLEREKIAVYAGFDPTADSLHIGNLVPIMLLVHFQRAGHRPIALVGGATGRVGDPTGRSAERAVLSREQLEHHLACQKAQLQQFLDFDPASPSAARMVNNEDWFGNWGFLDFIGEVGRHIPINYMLAKDSVKLRLENGMSFMEFCYQLIQGYDFVHLYRHYGCKVQVGGSDQWGNITTGTELIRRMDGGEAWALTAPLTKKSDGSKFGKSEGGNVWLDPQKTSPYRFYQFWLNVSDEEASRYLPVYTLLPMNEIAEAIQTHHQAPHLRFAQRLLAEEVTRMVHGERALAQARSASELLFGRVSREQMMDLDPEVFMQALEGVPVHRVPRNLLVEGCEWVPLLSDHSGIFSSRSEVRKMIEGGGLSLNREKCNDVQARVSTQDTFAHRLVLVQKGKKNFHLLVFEDELG
ncbi:MAG: tyrosine--tRNA ligase [Bacteroidia bacterium]